MSTPADPSSTGSMTREELAEADGRAMGRALAQRPLNERAAWWSGVVAEMGGPEAYRGLPAPPEGYRWAEEGGHTLRGSVGLAHLIPSELPEPGEPGAEDMIVARCGLGTGKPAALWMTVGRWESDRREACPACAGQETTT